MISKHEKRMMMNNLWSFGFKSYQEYLNSWYWEDKKKCVMKTECEKCGSKKQLQVHHKTYASLCNENQHDVICLCKQCHEEEHNNG